MINAMVAEFLRSPHGSRVGLSWSETGTPARLTATARRRGRQHKAFVMIGVLVVLGVISVLVLNWMRGAIARRGQVREADERLQAEWLAEAGLERAAARLAAKADYAGEVWSIGAAELGGPDGGRVEIHVVPLTDRPAARHVSVVADYPADPVRQSRVTKELNLEP
jgi:hypothetical protein